MSYKISVKRVGSCGECGAGLPIGSKAWWDPRSKKLTCLSHARGESSSAPPLDTLPAAQLEPPTEINQHFGKAAGSAQAMQRKFQERDKKRNDQENEIFTKKHPFLSKHFEVRATTSREAKVWGKGAAGETEVGKTLDSLATKYGFIAIHDRLMPRSKANFDHIAVTSSGVYVVDAKNYEGTIEVRNVLENYAGGKAELWIGNRNRSSLLLGVEKQIRAVEFALTAAGEVIAVFGVLGCVNRHWDLPTFLRPKSINGILINSKGLDHIFEKLPPNNFDEIARIAELLMKSFRSAS